MKKCNKCLEIKGFNFYHKDKSKADGFYGFCKICRSLNPTKTLDPEKIKVTRAKKNIRRKENLATIKKNKEYKKQYRLLNRDRILEYNRNRLKNNPIAKISKTLRNRLNLALKNKYKAGSAVSDLGCSIEEFKLYLESKFQCGMSWKNYGVHGWHIDHIKPLSKFDLEDINQFKIAAHYTNLQPLWAIDNLRKWIN